MRDFILRRADVRVLLWHLAFYGLGAILDDAGVRDLRLAWTPGMQPRATVGHDVDGERVDAAVREHAHARAGEPSWLLRDVTLRGSMRGLMSPRLAPFDGAPVWQHVQIARQGELDRLIAARSWLDLREIGALGEPCYWSRNRQGVAMQDDGASRLEMQPRNQGSEFVGSRLRKLAQVVAAREIGRVRAGLDGSSIVDEVGADRTDSRTATGLASPGPTDNAVAWCALWGISQLPIASRVNATALTSGHIGRTRSEWFYVPVWHAGWRPARLRTVLASRQLRDAARAGLPKPWGGDDTTAIAAMGWLAARGVDGLVRFEIARFGSDSAPERRAMLGVPLRTGMT